MTALTHKENDLHNRLIVAEFNLGQAEKELRQLREENEALRARGEEHMTDEDWNEIWEQFDWDYHDIEEEFQKELSAKHGEAHYYMDGDESWKRQKKLIQKLVEAKLKEKNT